MLVNKALRTTKTLLLQSSATYAKIIAKPVVIGSKRFYSDKTEEPDNNPPPKCQGPGGDSCAKLADVVCGKKVKKGKKKSGKEGFQFMHLLIDNKEICCDDPCPDASVRYDDCLYKESDKAKRKYQQTWVECPKIKIKPKEICCFPQFDYPPVPRRKPKKGTHTKKEEECGSALSLCPKITLPGCRAVADDIKCKRVKLAADCRKVKAPYPAYSECDRPKPRPKRKTECECLKLPPLCVIYKIMKDWEKAGKSFKCP